MKTVLALSLLLMLAGCGNAYPPPASVTEEARALLLIARELHDIFWLLFWLLLLDILGSSAK